MESVIHCINCSGVLEKGTSGFCDYTCMEEFLLKQSSKTNVYSKMLRKARRKIKLSK